MLTDPKLRSQVDSLWDKFWSGGLANPLDAIEQVIAPEAPSGLRPPPPNSENLGEAGRGRLPMPRSGS